MESSANDFGSQVASRLQYKKNYRPSSKLEVFFTGGKVDVSKDGSLLACPCNDEVKIIDVASGKVQRTFSGDTEPVTALALSPDGVSVFSASRSLQTKWWNLTSGECHRTWKAHGGPISDMDVDQSGGLLATGSTDRSVRVWDVEHGFCTHSFKGHESIVSVVRFHPDSHRLQLFSGGEDGAVRVWDLVTRTCVAVLKKHFSTITGLAFSSNGWTLLSAGRDKVVNIWDLRSNELEKTVPVYESLEGVCVLPEESKFPGDLGGKKKGKGKSSIVRFATVGENGLVRTWRSDRSTCLYEQPRPVAASASGPGGGSDSPALGLTAVHALPASDSVLCVTSDHRLLFYEPSIAAEGEEGEGGEGKKGERSSSPAVGLKLAKELIGYNDEITDLRFVGREEKLLAVATNSEQVRVYDVETLACVRSLAGGHTDTVLCLDTAVDASGRALLASAGKDHTVLLWNATSGACLGIGSGHMGAVGAVVFSRKTTSFLASAANDRTIKLWGLESALAADKAPGGEPRPAPTQLRALAVAAAHDKDINTLAVSPNDAFLASGSQDRTARVWRLPALSSHLTLRGHKRGVWCVAFSPVDQCVVTSSGDKTIRIWALSDGSCLKTFEGHTSSVLRVSFLTRGTQLISSGADGLVKLWTIRTGECVNTFDAHEDKVWALTVSRETEALASGGGDALVNIWEDCTAADEDAATKEEEEELLKDQDLSNALADTDYLRAVQLAFELGRPFKMLSVFESLLKGDEAEERLLTVVRDMEGDRLRVLLEYVREWNTNSRFCHTAQRVLQAVLSSRPPDQILEVPGLRTLLEGLLPYTQRHFDRLDRLVRSAFLLDFTLASMAVLGPAEDQQAATVDEILRRSGFLKKKGAALSADKTGKGRKRKTRSGFVEEEDGEEEGGEGKEGSRKKVSREKGEGEGERELQTRLEMEVANGEKDVDGQEEERRREVEEVKAAKEVLGERESGERDDVERSAGKGGSTLKGKKRKALGNGDVRHEGETNGGGGSEKDKLATPQDAVLNGVRGGGSKVREETKGEVGAVEGAKVRSSRKKTMAERFEDVADMDVVEASGSVGKGKQVKGNGVAKESGRTPKSAGKSRGLRTQ